MPTVHKAEAIVLKKRQLLQQDYVVTLFHQEQGKLKIIAKGIKKLTSRRAPHLETGNLINVILSTHKDTPYLQTTELISGFSTIKEHTQKLNILYTFFFILDRLLPEGQKEEGLYKITKSFLIELARSTELDMSFLQKYLQQLLINLGYLHEEKSLSELLSFTEEIINEKIPLHAIM